MCQGNQRTNSVFSSQTQIHQASLHTDTVLLEGGGKGAGSPTHRPYLHCLTQYRRAAAASICPSPTHAALSKKTWRLGWVLVAFAEEDQRVHSRTSELFKTYYPIPLRYSGLGNTTVFPYRDAESGAQMQLLNRCYRCISFTGFPQVSTSLCFIQPLIKAKRRINSTDSLEMLDIPPLYTQPPRACLPGFHSSPWAQLFASLLGLFSILPTTPHSRGSLKLKLPSLPETPSLIRDPWVTSFPQTSPFNFHFSFAYDFLCITAGFFALHHSISALLVQVGGLPLVLAANWEVRKHHKIMQD